LALLQVEDVGVSFGGIHALQGVDLEVDPGYVTGLIGPNGAGKTTLFNVITGLQEPTRGRIVIDGKDVTSTGTHMRARMGVGRTFQRLEVFGSLTARENILVAAEIRKRYSRDDSNPRRAADELLERVGLRAVANDRVDAMPTGLARLVELGRALATRPRLLLLDEPGSGLDEAETEPFAQLLEALARDGLAILIVEHDVDLVMRLCAKIYVLNFGEIIASGVPKEIQSNKAVQDAYLGASTEDVA
jgi:branched-chain amino acid transport system ATP-binding protein